MKLTHLVSPEYFFKNWDFWVKNVQGKEQRGHYFFQEKILIATIVTPEQNFMLVIEGDQLDSAQIQELRGYGIQTNGEFNYINFSTLKIIEQNTTRRNEDATEHPPLS